MNGLRGTVRSVRTLGRLLAAAAMSVLSGCLVSFDFPTFVGVTTWPDVDAGPPAPRAPLDFVIAGPIASTDTFMPYWGDDIFLRAEGTGLGDLDDDGDLDAIVSSVGIQREVAVLLRSDRVENGVSAPFVDVTAGAWPMTASPCMAVAHAAVYAPPLLIIAPVVPAPACAFRQTGPFELTGLSAVEMTIEDAAEIVALGDVSGDGALDVLHGGDGAPSHLLVSMRDHWEDRQEFPVDLSDLTAASLVDLDADRILDLVALTLGGGHVLRGLGGGAFASTESTVALETRGGAARRLAVADLDADAQPDLALFDVEAVPATLTIFFHGADPGVLAFDGVPIPLTVDVGGSIAIVPADADQDGVTDLVLATGDRVVVLQNHGDRTFSEREFSTTDLNDVHAGSVGDVDLDGDLDLVLCWGPTASPITRECSVVANQTNGSDFLELALRGGAGNAHAVGARVVVFPAGRLGDFSARPLAERTIGAGSTTPTSTMVHFGLPPEGRFDVRVYWPDATEPTDILGVERGSHLRVVAP